MCSYIHTGPDSICWARAAGSCLCATSLPPLPAPPKTLLRWLLSRGRSQVPHIFWQGYDWQWMGQGITNLSSRTEINWKSCSKSITLSCNIWSLAPRCCSAPPNGSDTFLRLPAHSASHWHWTLPCDLLWSVEVDRSYVLEFPTKALRGAVYFSYLPVLQIPLLKRQVAVGHLNESALTSGARICQSRWVQELCVTWRSN